MLGAMAQGDKLISAVLMFTITAFSERAGQLQQATEPAPKPRQQGATEALASHEPTKYVCYYLFKTVV